MDSIWQTLGLEGPTADLKIIKKAYAKKIREVRPDEDPAGFMALRQAFDHAKQMAPYLEETEAPVHGADLAGSDLDDQTETPDAEQARPWSYDLETDQDTNNSIDKAEHQIFEIESAPWPSEAPEQTPHQYLTIENNENARNESVKTDDERLMDSIKDLSNQNLQNFTKEWDRILEKRHDLSIDEYQQFEFSLTHYLIALFQDAEIEEQGHIEYHNIRPLNKPPLSGEIIEHIINLMGWETSDSLYSHNGLDEMTRLKFKSGAMNRHSSAYNYDSRITHHPTDQEETGSPVWLIVFLVVVGINLFRLLGDQGGYSSTSYDPARMEQIREMINAQRESPLLDLSSPSGRSFDDIEFEEYFDMLRDGTSTADRLNRLRFENYLMRPETDISFLLNAKENGTLTPEQDALLDSALDRMRSRWLLRQRASGPNALDPNKELSPEMQKLLKLETNSPAQNLDKTLKMLEGLSVDPSKD